MFRFVFSVIVLTLMVILKVVKSERMLINTTASIAFNSKKSNSTSSSSGTCNITQFLLALEYDCGFESIHGLWPDPEETCTYCTDEPFDESQLSSETLAQMEKYWPSCVDGNTNESFWSHEWEKHGTCSGMSQEGYFSETLSLFGTYKGECSSNCYLCFTPELAFQGQC